MKFSKVTHGSITPQTNGNAYTGWNNELLSILRMCKMKKKIYFCQWNTPQNSESKYTDHFKVETTWKNVFKFFHILPQLLLPFLNPDLLITSCLAVLGWKRDSTFPKASRQTGYLILEQTAWDGSCRGGRIPVRPGLISSPPLTAPTQYWG